MHLLAPGFHDPGERFPHAVEFVRLSVPYVAVAGLVAVAAAMLNAEGRVGAAAFGLVIFNVVMMAAVLIVLLSGIGATPLAGAILSAAIVVGGRLPVRCWSAARSLRMRGAAAGAAAATLARRAALLCADDSRACSPAAFRNSS